MNLKHRNNKILKYYGDDYVAFQKDEFRIYSFLDDLMREFCDKGILTGDMFYFGLINDTLIFDKNGNYSTNKKMITPKRITNFKTDFLPDLEEDLKNFNGHKVLLVPPAGYGYSKGSSVDTLVFRIDADLTGTLPGPVQRYKLIITCEALDDFLLKDIRQHKFKFLKTHKFIYIGGIL